jgi:kanamycin kinase
VEIPAHLRKTFAEWDRTPVWQAAPQVIVYRLRSGSGEVRYLKIAERSWHPGLLDEAERMRWARECLPVPAVVGAGAEGDVSWLLTAAMPGVSGVDPAWMARPRELVEILARGLRRFHDVPVAGCPFDFRLDAALELAARRVHGGDVVPERDFHPEHLCLTASEALQRLERTRPATEDLVVCHGDYCFPNVLISGGEATGFLDLGELGVADRWWDLAVATWSTVWNVGAEFEAGFLRTYGIEPDPDRIAYYRLLYDVVS